MESGQEVFDADKALEAFLYIADKASIADIYHVATIAYYADGYHLSEFGRTICGDRYIATDYGQVPSGIHDIYKIQKFKDRTHFSEFSKRVKQSFNVSEDQITVSREPDLELLSDSDLACLDKAIAEFGAIEFEELKVAAHRDPAFQRTDRGTEIALSHIVDTMPNAELLHSHLAYRGATDD